MQLGLLCNTVVDVEPDGSLLGIKYELDDAAVEGERVDVGDGEHRGIIEQLENPRKPLFIRPADVQQVAAPHLDRDRLIRIGFVVGRTGRRPGRCDTPDHEVAAADLLVRNGPVEQVAERVLTDDADDDRCRSPRPGRYGNTSR